MWHKLLFGTGYPVTTIPESLAGLDRLVGYASKMPFPSFTKDDMQRLIDNDVLSELNLA